MAKGYVAVATFTTRVEFWPGSDFDPGKAFRDERREGPFWEADEVAVRFLVSDASDIVAAHLGTQCAFAPISSARGSLIETYVLLVAMTPQLIGFIRDTPNWISDFECMMSSLLTAELSSMGAASAKTTAAMAPAMKMALAVGSVGSQPVAGAAMRAPPTRLGIAAALVLFVGIAGGITLAYLQLRILDEKVAALGDRMGKSEAQSATSSAALSERLARVEGAVGAPSTIARSGSRP